MSPRVQRLLAVGAASAGLATFGFAAGGLAGTDDQMREAAVKTRLAVLEHDRAGDCPPREGTQTARPEL
jgi:hypothetical protein